MFQSKSFYLFVLKQVPFGLSPRIFLIFHCVAAQVFITGFIGVYEYDGYPSGIKGIALWRAKVAFFWE